MLEKVGQFYNAHPVICLLAGGGFLLYVSLLEAEKSLLAAVCSWVMGLFLISAAIIPSLPHGTPLGLRVLVMVAVYGAGIPLMLRLVRKRAAQKSAETK